MELSERLTYWTAPHPSWRTNPEWSEDVGCVLFAGSDATVVIDPLIRDDLDSTAWDWLDRAVTSSGAPVAVLLTAAWHMRSTREVVDRYGASVWGAPLARPRFRDLRHLDELPRGVQLFAPQGVDEGQVAFILPDEATLVVGDFLLGTGHGLRVCPSPATTDLGAFRRSLTTLDRLLLERVLVGHGPPILHSGSKAIAAAIHALPPPGADSPTRRRASALRR